MTLREYILFWQETYDKSRIENNSLLVELFTVNLMQHNRAPHVLHHI